jgi:hypothetical protein
MYLSPRASTCDRCVANHPLIFPLTCTPASTAVTQHSLIPKLNSTPPDTTWCGVCVPFSAFVGPSCLRFCSLWTGSVGPHFLVPIRTPTVAGRAQHHDQDPQVRDTTRPARALFPIELCVCTRVCAVNCLRGDTLLPVRTAVVLSQLARASFLYEVCSAPSSVLPRPHVHPLCTFPAIVLRGAVCFAWFVTIGRFCHHLHIPLEMGDPPARPCLFSFPPQCLSVWSRPDHHLCTPFTVARRAQPDNKHHTHRTPR